MFAERLMFSFAMKTSALALQTRLCEAPGCLVKIDSQGAIRSKDLWIVLMTCVGAHAAKSQFIPDFFF